MADVATLTDELERSRRHRDDLARAGDALAFLLRTLAWHGAIPPDDADAVREGLDLWRDVRA